MELKAGGLLELRSPSLQDLGLGTGTGFEAAGFDARAPSSRALR